MFKRTPALECVSSIVMSLRAYVDTLASTATKCCYLPVAIGLERQRKMMSYMLLPVRNVSFLVLTKLLYISIYQVGGYL